MIFLKIEKIATSNTKLYLQIIIFWKASILNGIILFRKIHSHFSLLHSFKIY